MRCNLCDGSGMQHTPIGLTPCPECGGCGVAHCCDGLVACGEVEGDIRFDRAKISEASMKASQPQRPEPTGKS